MSRRLARSCLFLLLAAAPAFAQDQPPKRDGRKGDGPRIRMGSDPEPAPEEPKPDAAAKSAEKSEAELLVELLARWPDAEARQAMVRLAAEPSVSYPLLERKMLEANQDWRMIAGVSATLGRIRDLRAVELIRAKLEDRKMYQHSGELIEALTAIDPVGAKPRLIALLLHPASPVVVETEKRLATRVAAADLGALRDVYDSGGPAARGAALRLMTRADPVGCRADLVKALRDKEPEVAYAAAHGLAADEGPEAADLIARAMNSPTDRQFAYAVIAAALRAERTGTRAVDAAGVDTLLGGRGLKSLDQLCRAAAAVALADEGYFHDVPALDESFDRIVVPVLIDVWVGREFWPDMKVIHPLVLRRLRRITGRLDMTTPQEWASWWEQEGSKFQARRVLLDVPETAAATLVVTVDGAGAPGGETTTITASPELLTVQMPDDLTILVTEDEARELARSVNASGVLRAPEGSSSSLEVPGALGVAVRSGKRERRSILRSGALTPELERFVADVTALRARYSWQRYRTAVNAVDAQSFLAAMSPAFARDRPEADREASLASLIVHAIEDRRGSAWNAAALKELEELRSLPKSLEAADVDRLLSVLGRRTSLDPVAQGIVRVLAKTKRPEVVPLVLEFLATHEATESRELMTFVLKNAPREQFLQALADNRREVRLAAYAASDRALLGDEGIAALLKAVDTRDPGIGAEAVRTLGRLRITEAAPLIDRLAEKPGDLRAAAVEALGMLGGQDSLSTIMTAYASDDTALRVAALKGLSASREPQGLSAIVFAMGNDPSPLVREVAARAILDMGTDRAAAELRKLAIDPAQPVGPRARAVTGYASLRGREAAPDLARLVDDPADEVADEAALALARWRDPAAVPRLIAMLETERGVKKARQGLESISLESFGQKEPRLVADLYAGWWETSQERGPKRWLLDALSAEGAEDAALRAWSEGQAGREAVPALLLALRNEKWYVRRAADLALRDLLGKSVGDVEPWTTSGEVERIADAWEKIWAATLAR